MSAPFTVKELAQILDMLQKYDVSEFRLERSDERISIRRGAQGADRNVTVSQPVHMPIYQPQYAPQMPPVVPAVGGGSVTVSEAPSQIAPASREPANGAVKAPSGKALHDVVSPMVGTFYRRPAVDAEPYVKQGDVIKKGDVLCIVEAMKLMNEIESDVAGRIAEVCLEDGQMAEYGEVLFRIEPL